MVLRWGERRRMAKRRGWQRRSKKGLERRAATWAGERRAKVLYVATSTNAKVEAVGEMPTGCSESESSLDVLS